MGVGPSKNSSPGGNVVPLEAKSGDKLPVRPMSLSPSKSPSPNRPEVAAIQIPEASKESSVACDPRSPTIDMARTPLVEAASFVDPRSPDNNILRTPLDKSSGFKGFKLDESLPYIDESQETSKPISSPPKLSLAPRNLDLSLSTSGETEELSGAGDFSLDSSVDVSPGTPSDGFDTVKAFDAAIGDELDREDTLNELEKGSSGDAASATAVKRQGSAVGGIHSANHLETFSSDDRRMIDSLLSIGFSPMDARSSETLQLNQMDGCT